MFNHASRRRPVVALAALATLASSFSVLLTTAPAQAAPDGSGLVINEVYGGGGNSGATLTNDFIELYNPTDADIDVDGWSVQYRSSTGTAVGSNITPLEGTVPAGGTYLIEEGAGTGGTTVLPEPDAAGTIAMAGGSGQVFLLRSTTAFGTTTGNLAGDRSGNAALVDMIGYGTAGSYETAPTGVALTSTTSASRTDGVDSDHNADNFGEGAPTPVNSAGEEPAPPEDLGERTVAQLQGTGATSPAAGDIATTKGVVTARYPTGGLGGFFLQTGGTGGATDATPGASDGIFVYAPKQTEQTMPAVGASVQVRGLVVEFNGLTEITAIASNQDVAVTTIPALSPVTPLATTLPATEATREAHEGELIAPQGDFTVTDVYSTNQYAEIGLASGTTPLRQPSDAARPGTAQAAAIAADNAARAITLDDGAAIDFLSTANNRANMQIPLPWLTQSRSIRVGADADFAAPVVMDFRNNTWKFQPQSRVTDAGTDVATFEDTRPANAAPQSVGGNLKLATFNVLNYFNTTGAAFEARGGTCTYYYDRDGDDPVAVNSCNPNGPRGAAEPGDLNRQQAKIVRAINTMDADIVSLEEIENSVKLIGETNRDDAVQALVNALNSAAGERRWAFAASPAAADLPALAEQDVIRTAFIYDPSTVAPVGASKVLVGSAPFANAREPLAQAFKPAGSTDESAFAVIVNHFKSKSPSGATGDNVDSGDGAGGYNGDRVRQARALVDFANSFAAERGTDEVFLTGDFNSYSEEQPMQVLYGAGFAKIESDDAGDHSYSFDGLSGSLDHVLGNAAANRMVSGADVWEINANEPIAYQYSRFNYNPTRFFSAADPFAASDHNPEVVGLDADADGTEIQILGTNDFHGRLLANGAEAGAAVLSGAVKQLRAENPNTVFSAAGDLIGASTFESFIQDDEPTIDALNEAGLEVSAAGNHEFDQGYEDLVGRVQERADWEYIAANIEEPDGRDDLAESWVQDFDGVKVGFVGAVTEDLPTLVSPDGIEGVGVTDIVEATNAEAAKLTADGADLVVLLVHEGAPSTAYADAVDPTNAFGKIVTGVSPDVDAIISGHTHLAYNHSVPVPEWAAQGRAVTERPVVSAGQYGTNLNQLKFQLDDDGELVAKSQTILPLATDTDGSGPGTTFVPNYPVDQPTKEIVDEAVKVANELGARKLGAIDAPFYRAKLADGTTENRGGESTLGNLVAEIQRWATSSAESGAAQIAFMNPGGLRADLTGTGTSSPRDVTYRQAATVQPFANTLVNMSLTGAEIEKVLEEQWQPAGASRPFLRLGVSEGFTYTYTPPAAGSPAGTRGEVTGMWLDGEPVGDTDTYSVTVNSFLAAGGDGFTTLGERRAKQDTGKSDLQAQVDYFAAFASDAPLEVDFSQRSVGATFPAGAPASYGAGDTVQFSLSSLSMTGPGDLRDSQVVVSLGDDELGTFPVTTTVQSALPGYDEAGTASVSVVLPAGVASGTQYLTVTGATTGTSAQVPVTVESAPAPEPVTPTITVSHSPSLVYVNRTSPTINVRVLRDGQPATGQVQIAVEGKGTATVSLVDGRASRKVSVFRGTGNRTVTVTYLGNETTRQATARHTIRVRR